MPRLGSRVRIPSPAPKLQLLQVLAGSLQHLTPALQLSRQHQGGTGYATLRDPRVGPLPKEWASDGSLRFSGFGRAGSPDALGAFVARSRPRCGTRDLRIPSDLLRNPLPSVQAGVPLVDRRYPGSEAFDVPDVVRGYADPGYAGSFGAPRSMRAPPPPDGERGSKVGRCFLCTRHGHIGGRDRAPGAVTRWDIEEVLPFLRARGRRRPTKKSKHPFDGGAFSAHVRIGSIHQRAEASHGVLRPHPDLASRIDLPLVARRAGCAMRRLRQHRRPRSVVVPSPRSAGRDTARPVAGPRGVLVPRPDDRGFGTSGD